MTLILMLPRKKIKINSTLLLGPLFKQKLFYLIVTVSSLIVHHEIKNNELCYNSFHQTFYFLWIMYTILNYVLLIIISLMFLFYGVAFRIGCNTTRITYDYLKSVAEKLFEKYGKNLFPIWKFVKNALDFNKKWKTLKNFSNHFFNFFKI